LKIHRVKSAGQGQALAAELFAGISDESPDFPVGLATGGTMSVFTRRSRPMASAQNLVTHLRWMNIKGLAQPAKTHMGTS